jgi:hypothetical protein
MQSIPKDKSTLLICAMSKVCSRTSCMHRQTHKFGHSVCYTVSNSNMCLCKNFLMAKEYRPLTYLQHESNVYIKSKHLRYGFCTTWDYWKEHMTDKRHILIGQWSRAQLIGMADALYRGAYTPLWNEKTYGESNRTTARISREAYERERRRVEREMEEARRQRRHDAEQVRRNLTMGEINRLMGRR